MNYSVFISYRREGGFDTACLIAEKLRNKGYRVFLDVESMRSGKFNEQLYSVIGNCVDFVLVLPAGALDRCANEDDWLRKEIMYAQKTHKNIIPVMLKGFSWPAKMPEGMEELDKYQGVAAGDISYFDSSMDRLISYLKSHRRIISSKAVKYTLASLVVLCILGVGYIISRMASSVPVCQEQVTKMVSQLSKLNVLVDESDAIEKAWKDFYHSYEKASYSNRQALVKEMASTLDFYDSEISSINMDTAAFELSDRQKKMMRIRGLDPAAVEIFHNSLIPGFFDDAHNAVDILRKYLGSGDVSEISLSTADVNARMFRHSANSVYYAFLSECASLPDKIMKPYSELSVEWVNFPVYVGLHLPKQEYDRLQASEMKKAEDLVSELGHMNTKLAFDLENEQDALDAMTQRAAAEAVRDEINERIDRVIDKSGELVSRQKALQEAADKVDETAESVMEKCTLSSEDDQYYMWGKIIRLGSLLNLTVTSRSEAKARAEKEKAEAEKMGFDTSGWFEAKYRVTPEVVLGKIHESLDLYQGWFPETSVYVPAVKQYFSDLVNRKYKAGGMVVMATKDNLEHPVLRLGDIVVSRNGTPVNTVDDFSGSRNEAGEDILTFLRLENGTLVKHTEVNPKNDVSVGLLPLVE